VAKALIELREIPVTRLAGVGPAKAESLAELGITSVLDLLLHYPRRYVDRTKQATIRDLGVGEEANQPWRAKQLPAGTQVVVFGKLEMFQGRKQMTNPVVDLVGDRTGKIIPIYPQSEKARLNTWDLAEWIDESLRRAVELTDPVPEAVLDRLNLVSRDWALRHIHEPESMEEVGAARKRLVFDELLRIQLVLVRRKRQYEASSKGIGHDVGGALLQRFVDTLPWPLTGAQARAIREIETDLAKSVPMHRLLQGDVGAGKAQPLDALVLTPGGFREMQDLRVGDEVVTPCGELAVVDGVFPQGDRPVWRLVFADGTSVRADDEHLWVVNTSVGRSRGRAPKVKTTAELRADLFEKNGASKWHVERPEPVDLDDGGDRPLDPYLLGLLLGDGSFRWSMSFSSADAELIEAVELRLPQACFLKRSSSRPYDYTIRCSYKTSSANAHPLAWALDRLGLRWRTSHDKFVPRSYLNAAAKDRHALLQGLLDTDGTVQRNGCDVNIVIASRQLAEDVRWLVQSLGGVGTLRVVRKVGNEYFRVGIRLPNDRPPFRLKRKADRWRPRTKYANPARAIRSIELDGVEPVQCISVAHASHMYVTDHFTPTHNTLVAVATMLTAVQGGHQAALMAPTEVLAEQHGLGVRRMLEGFTVPSNDGSLFEDRSLTVALLTNRTTPKERMRILDGLASGSIDIAIGTHALIQDKVAFRSLGVVVIDEQHRFGVEQRAALRSKGELVPDVLVMTATPIPRTAAMTVYGDLDVSVLDELPPGRTPIKTTWARGPLAEAEAWQRVRDEVAAGHQAYVVAPLIEESEKLEVASAQETFDSLSADELQGLRIGLLHGKMKSADKEATMVAFRGGELDVLVATTVIEVGVDVPNATVMVIIDADRFGIAQLHQLRGRVGRGADVSFCYLLGAGDVLPGTRYDDMSDSGKRLHTVERTTDGFELAEVDLDLRGEGTIMGVKQKGRNDLRLASLRRDKAVVATAREIAFELVDGGLDRHPALVEEVDTMLPDEEDETEFLFKS
jgi:ATP-dependent DNA helicase RecG